MNKTFLRSTFKVTKNGVTCKSLFVKGITFFTNSKGRTISDYFFLNSPRHGNETMITDNKQQLGIVKWPPVQLVSAT